MTRRWRGPLGAALGMVLAPASALPAQSASGYAAVATSAHVHGTVVAVALRLPVGSQDDPPGQEGSATLVARALEDQVNAGLDASSATLTARVDRTSTLFNLLSVPEAWQGSWRIVDSVLFEASLDTAFAADRRRELLDRLSFEVGSPVLDFEREATGLLADPGSPWVRPPTGTPESLARVVPEGLRRFHSERYRRASAALAVVGPVPPDSTVLPPQPTPPPGPSGGAAWIVGDRVELIRDVTSTWLSVAWPVPSDMPRIHLEMIAHQMVEDLDPTPPDPDRFQIHVRVAETPRGPVLVADATVFPEAADRWEARILGSLDRLAGQPVSEDFFRWPRRRFRTARLLDESLPEAEAARIAADLLREGRPRDVALEIGQLEGPTLREAARALGPPRIFRFGPDLRLDQEGGTGARSDRHERAGSDGP